MNGEGVVTQPVTPQAAPAPAAVTNPAPTGTPEFQVPEAYASQSWAQNIKGSEDLWRDLSNAQQLIGRKGIIKPDEHSSPEIVSKYRQDMGIPEAFTGYEFSNAEVLGDAPRDLALDAKVKELAHKYELPKTAAEGFVKETEALLWEQSKEQREFQQAVEAGYDTMLKEVFGDDAESGKAAFKSVMLEALGNNPVAAGKLEGLDNDALGVIMAYGKAIHDKYVGESKVNKSASPVAPEANLKSQFSKLSSEKIRINNDPNISMLDKQNLLRDINMQMMSISSKAKELDLNLFG